jgi:hypothetical protein
MLVFFSGRRLKPERWEEFREAWGPSGDELKEHLPEGAVAVYHARNVKDPDEVISFGIFDVDAGDRDAVRGDEEEELKRQEAMGKAVHDTPLEGVYEVIEEIRP